MHFEDLQAFDGMCRGEFKTSYEYPGDRITCRFIGFVDISDGIAACEFEKELEQLINRYEKQGVLGFKKKSSPKLVSLECSIFCN
ncbi:hypothetical protein [uncultured Treponema sp.]|uniref:hypothetical protein n=1 Tax=uncultured Treponema sp. TaxID=162155 RepID=UPI0025DFC23F|nr:hypothetical protein [uncultured Treponema sp.]